VICGVILTVGKQQYSREIGLREKLIASALSEQANRLQPIKCRCSHGSRAPFLALVFQRMRKGTVPGTSSWFSSLPSPSLDTGSLTRKWQSPRLTWRTSETSSWACHSGCSCSSSTLSRLSLFLSFATASMTRLASVSRGFAATGGD